MDLITSSGEEFLRFAKDDDVDSAMQLYNDLSSFIESEGPFDGVMAFSEGAGVAASLLAYQERLMAAQKSSPFRFKFGIFFCGAGAFDAESLQQGILRELDPSVDGRVITMPTAHIWTRHDQVHPGFGQKLRALCADGVAEEYLHDFGHSVPGAQGEEGVVEATRVIRRTIERATRT